MAQSIIHNPILPGFHPDPSICRVGEDYYLACSSFSFYPGIPLYHSKDLAHWEPIGYALDRMDQLTLTPDNLGGGLYAPTLRYHDGLFYLIVTNVTTGECILVTTDDPAGDWSVVHELQGGGADPSLFWDDDGTCWCTFNLMSIMLQQLDTESWQFVGEARPLWDGSTEHAFSPEGSHLYKRDGWYYLLIAEGGTEHYHAVCVARSRTIEGPYESYVGNPILTHRHLGMYYPICNIGHGDLVEAPDGSWYMVVLGSRIYGGYHKNMGRETYICPVIWENGWPIAAPGTGRVEMSYPAPEASAYDVALISTRDDFDGLQLGDQWNYIGTPTNTPARLADSRLYIRTVPEAIWRMLPRDPVPPRSMPPEMSDIDPMTMIRQMLIAARASLRPAALGFVGRRQSDCSYIVRTRVAFHPQDARETAGIVLLQNKYNQIRLEIAMEDGRRVIRAVRYQDTRPMGVASAPRPEIEIPDIQRSDILGTIPCPEGEIVLELRADLQQHGLYAGTEGHLLQVAEGIDGSFLGSESCDSFIGAYIGMFASGNGADTGNEAGFAYFDYEPVAS